MKKLFKALFIITSFSVLTRSLGFLFRIFLSRAIGPEELGIYQIAFSVFMVLETFISSGIPLIVSKSTANFVSFKKSKSENSLITSALIVGLITSLIICFVLLILKNFLHYIFTDSRCINILFTLLPALVFSTVYSTLRGNLWGHKKYFWVSVTEFFEQIFRILFCILLFAFLDSNLINGTKIASLSYVFSCLFSSIIVLVVYLKEKGRFGKPNIKLTKAIIKSSTPITLVRVVSSLLAPLISIIIPMQLVNTLGYSNSQALSLFGIAMGMTFPLLYIPSTLISSLSTTLIPDISTAIVQNKNDEINLKINFAIKFGFFVSFLFIPIFMAVGEEIGMFLFKEIQSGIFLANSSFLIIPICTSGITVSCLNALGLEVKGFVHYAIGAMFLLFCIFFLTKFLGIYSLVWGMALCLGIASILNLILLNKKQHKNFFNFSYLLKLILCGIPSFLITKWLCSLLKISIGNFLSLTISCIIGELFFLSMALIFNLIDLSFLKFKKAKNKII